MKKNTFKTLIIYIISILLIVAPFKIYGIGLDSSIYKSTSLNTFLYSMAIILFLFFFSGFRYSFFMKKVHGINFSLFDTLALPFSINLWSYIIPVQGSLVFSTFFLKKKYRLEYNKGLPMSIYFILNNWFVVGVIGLLLCIINNIFNSIIFLFSFLILLPFIVLALSHTNIIFLKKFSVRFTNFLQNVNANLSKLILNFRLNLSMLFFSSMVVLINFFWFYIICLEFSINISVIQTLLLSFFTLIIQLLKLTPANLGIQELFTGIYFEAIGQDYSIGIFLALFWRLSSLPLILLFGILHLFINMKFIYEPKELSIKLQ